MSSSVGGGGGGGAGGAGGDIASLLEKAKELDQLRKEEDEVVTEINKMHKKILTCVFGCSTGNFVGLLDNLAGWDVFSRRIASLLEHHR
ncbi:hypothetical protein GUJ93_ZPchr0009g442 [Zizania palustris]|uniref:Uncharacterized protein n=1 Tax=Zizania palustris TaxID=103762 RepID=A0A8J5RY80_ZIZPA|nr:hypothetical protein GUJ93_ZPchr0009g442 [Zizania palustris]